MQAVLLPRFRIYCTTKSIDRCAATPKTIWGVTPKWTPIWIGQAKPCIPFTYSPQDKLLVHKQKINTLPEQLICSNTYDELGQLISKKVGGSDTTGQNGLQKVDYKYNIRGWLKKINEVDGLDNDLFAFKINYEDPENSVALFNGNISETYWKTASDNLKRKYSYQYDDLNRLLEGNYSREGGNFKNSYLETMNYDKNGNIQTMYRNGDNDDVNYEFNIDNLVYTYDQNNKNLLKKVFDASNSPQGFKDDSNGFDDPEDDYEYDANGNLTADANKKIQNITYNHLNLPVHIVFETGEITYLYNATGQKLQKSVEGSDSITTDYLTGFQYFNQKLKHFPHAEGYVNVVAGKYKYVFNYTDHLGNVRLEYSDADDNNTITQNEIIEENHYYPFGLKHSAYNTQHLAYMPNDQLNDVILNQMPRFAGDGENNYLYNGKEYQDELGLNMTAMDYRQYDSAIGRFVGMDRLAEMTPNWTPYRFAFNNPVVFADPSGLSESKGNIGADGLTNEQWLAQNRPKDSPYAQILQIEKDMMARGVYRDTETGTYSLTKPKTGRFKRTFLYNEFSDQMNTSLTTDLSPLILKPIYMYYAEDDGYGYDFNNSNSALDIIGGIYGGLQGMTSSQRYWLGNNGKYYSNSWGGNRYTGSRTGAFKAASNYKLASRAIVISSVLLGGYMTYEGYVADGGQFGYNAKMAAASSAGSIAGGWAGAQAGAFIGAEIGALFGGFGAIPGAVIGGVIGGFGFGMAGGYYGSQLGGSAVNYYYGR